MPHIKLTTWEDGSDMHIPVELLINCVWFLRLNKINATHIVHPNNNINFQCNVKETPEEIYVLLYGSPQFFAPELERTSDESLGKIDIGKYYIKELSDTTCWISRWDDEGLSVDKSKLEEVINRFYTGNL